MGKPFLLLDPDPKHQARVETLARDLGYAVAAHSGAWNAKLVNSADLVVLDLDDPRRTEWMERLEALPAPPAVILLADRDGLHSAQETYKGVFDCLEKPVHHGALAACVGRLALWRALQRERDQLRTPQEKSALEILLGHSPAAQRLSDQLARIAGTPRTTVLVTGRRGARLDAVARVIHQRSARATGPFLRLSCSGRPPAELEKELLAPSGLLAAAQGGTLFLEEVADLPARCQNALLKVLEEGVLAGGGPGQGEHLLDVRIIAATHQDLEATAAMGRFRSDLLYRLNVLTLSVPRLAERGDDVLAISAGMLARMARSVGIPIPELTPAVQKALREHPWTWELDELESWLARLLVIPVQSPDPELLPMPPLARHEPGDAIPAPPDRSLRSMEESLIRRVLSEEDQNRSRAARILGINRATLYNKLRQYGIA